MTLILSNDDVERLLTIDDCIAALDEGYREIGEGRAANRTRSDIVTPTVHEGGLYALKSMDGVIPKRKVAAIRINSDILTWEMKAGNRVRVKKPAAPGERYVGLVLLFSTDTGEPLAIFPDGVMQRLRVAATSGLGAKLLARKNAKTVALLGAGWQAGSQAMAICAVRDIQEIRVYSPTPATREAFCREMANQVPARLTPMTSPEAAVKGADIVLCATNSLGNVFKASWVEPGMHLGSIKPAELEPAAVAKAAVAVTHFHDNEPTIIRTHVDPAKEDKHGVRHEPTGLDESALPTLPDLVLGRCRARQSDAEVTAFLNHAGLGYQFAVCGAALLDKARAAKAGNELPTEWFTEDVHP
ncbi:MAG TPA: ornithine cyclodeaminase family protein [Alphaproteobacteria bacterium]|nr:ornithine cyclodeaminase family protein [Alphaproteobacteria bacterium]